LESMKTSPSDSGSFEKILDVYKLEEQELKEDPIIYQMSDPIRKDLDIFSKGKDKHERGVTKGEYSKFRAKLPFITP